MHRIFKRYQYTPVILTDDPGCCLLDTDTEISHDRYETEYGDCVKISPESTMCLNGKYVY